MKGGRMYMYKTQVGFSYLKPEAFGLAEVIGKTD